MGPKLERCPRVLLVEGFSDLYFYAEVLESLTRFEGVFIQQFGGKGNLTSEALEDFLDAAKLAEKTHIAVLVDADGDALGTARSLETSLSRITSQTVVNAKWTSGKPCVGLYVVPGEGAPGAIETLAWNAWSNDPGNNAARVCIETYFECMKGQGHTPKSIDKGRVGALLSVLFDEDPRLGPGARARRFDFSRPEFTPLLDFLRGLPAQ